MTTGRERTLVRSGVQPSGREKGREQKMEKLGGKGIK